MSTLIKWALEQKCPNGTTKAVLLALAGICEINNESFPIVMVKYADLANKCSISVRSTIRAIETLQSIGLIQKTKRWKKNGRQDWNLYEILMDPSSLLSKNQNNSRNLPYFTRTYPENYNEFWFNIPVKQRNKDERNEIYNHWSSLTEDERKLANKSVRNFYSLQNQDNHAIHPVIFLKDRLWKNT